MTASKYLKGLQAEKGALCAFFLLLALPAWSTRVYRVTDPSEADTVVYVVRDKSQADELVYIGDCSLARDREDVWCYVENKSEATMSVFFTNNPSEASVKVFFVRDICEAGGRY